MEVIPSKGYKIDVRPYPISIQDFVNTMRYLKENNEKYYMIYKLMIESGTRISHALMLIKSFGPNEVVEINGLGIDTPRLVCFDDKNFCRYYLGLREVVKPCEWAYFSVDTLRLIEKYKNIHVDRYAVVKYAKRNGLILPKYIRKISWRLMIKIMPREIARFIQSRLGELKISEARYEDLLAEADEYYPKYLEYLNKLIAV
jgi:intergrase/recombinase